MNRRDFIKSLTALAGSAVLGKRETATVQNPPLPLQPFTIELLDMYRGSWQFLDWDGQHLHLGGPVRALAYPGGEADSFKLAYLCCDPEFPRDPAHATLRYAAPVNVERSAARFIISDPFFTCSVTVKPAGQGILECVIENLTLGPAVTGDRYVEALYLVPEGAQRDTLVPVWLAPSDMESGPPIRLLTDQVGNIFSEDERLRVTLVGFGSSIRREADISLDLLDYHTGDRIWHHSQRLSLKAGQISLHTIALPLERFGIFILNASCNGRPVATLRICRIPTPRRVHPDSSKIGINTFQQQIWWYAFQVPMMAAAGVRWIRPWLAWENTWSTQQPQPGKWDTRALDAALRRMDRYGMRYQDILCEAPDWVSNGAPFGVPPMNRLNEWGDYVHRLVTQYRGRIPYYEVWNEPDGMWTKTTNAAEQYLAMLKITWQAAKRADPHCKILGLSLAGDINWLQRVCDGGARKYMDVATFHNYASPYDFRYEAQKRIEVLGKHHINRFWINELGTTAYDFNAAYSQKYDCSERKQAATLVENYAQALTLNPDMKAYWFCTYDPRDAAHESGWTADAGIGVLYLGFLPKLAYAALAGFAKMVDGRRCLGLAQNTEAGISQVSFDGPVAVAWRTNSGQANRTTATSLGCLDQESIVVQDIFTNRSAGGKAADITLDFSKGPLYIVGSRQMAGIASVGSAFQLMPDELTLGSDPSAIVLLEAPLKSSITVEVHPASDFSARLAENGNAEGRSRSILVGAKRHTGRLCGAIAVRCRVKPPNFSLLQPIEQIKLVPITANGGPDLIRDGGFYRNDLSDWTIQGSSAVALDLATGHTYPGCLRLSAPFKQRLVQWNITVDRKVPLHFRFWVKSQNLTGCRITLNLAWFGPKGWVSTDCLATTGEPGSIEEGWSAVEGVGRIPTGTGDWKEVSAILNPPFEPSEADHAAFFVDAVGGGTGAIWLDDLDLWQP